MTPMKSNIAILAALVLSAATAPGFAQVYQSSYPQRPVQWFIDAGGSVTQNQTGDFFDNGWSIGTGLNFRPDPAQPFSLRAEVNYNRFEATGEFISLNEQADQTPIDHGSMQTVTGFVDAVLDAPLNPWMRLYALGGVGLGYRRIELTQNGDFFCNSFLCGPGFGRNTLVASDDTTHFAWNAGLGLDFPLPAGQSWFVEARYERIETVGATEFVPIRIGIRF